MHRLVILALASFPLACADPCVDDGVNQEKKENCPGQAASASASETETASNTDASATEDASATDSQTASATQASMSASGAEETDEASATAATGDTTATSDASADADASATGGPGCDNGMLDGDESDVDCGGSCAPCDDGETCFHNPDCKSMTCALDMTCGIEDSCTQLVDDNSCQACIKSSCCDEVLECYMDEFCKCWVECIEHNNDFDPCVETCMGTGKPGAITSCANSQCNDATACGN